MCSKLIAAHLFEEPARPVIQESVVEKEKTNPCTSDGIRSVSRPYFAGEKEEPKFTLKYRHRPAKKGAPTVIVIPGGPGLGSIEYTPEAFGSFPKDVGLVFTDPRGIGCNEPKKGVEYPAEFYSTKNLASDILAIVKDLQLPDYVLFGESYGTVVAQVAAALAEKNGDTLPKALVLDGTLGRAFKGDEVFESYRTQWHKVSAALPQSVRKQFGDDPPPLGLSNREWGTWLASQLNFRKLPQTDHFIREPWFKELRTALGQEGSAEKKQELKTAIQNDLKKLKEVSPHAKKMFLTIACREISDRVRNMEFEFELKKGQLHFVESVCPKKTMDRRFDVADFKTSAPIYYFQGMLDPSTPPFQTEYSVDSQTRAKRIQIIVEDGAHSSLTESMMQDDQHSRAIWGNILSSLSDGDLSGLHQAFRNTGYRTIIRVRSPD